MIMCKFCTNNDRERISIDVGDINNGFNLFGGVHDEKNGSHIELCLAYKRDVLSDEVYEIPIHYCPMCGRKLDGSMQ